MAFSLLTSRISAMAANARTQVHQAKTTGKVTTSILKGIKPIAPPKPAPVFIGSALPSPPKPAPPRPAPVFMGSALPSPPKPAPQVFTGTGGYKPPTYVAPSPPKPVQIAPPKPVQIAPPKPVQFVGTTTTTPPGVKSVADAVRGGGFQGKKDNTTLWIVVAAVILVALIGSIFVATKK